MPSKQVFSGWDGALYTTSTGAPVGEPYAADRIGINGPLLLQDFHHIDLLAHFDRERVPERVVHAKGAGAHGKFEVTQDISDLCCASLFSKVGNVARATARFSTVGGESGSADTARDPRGFSVKLRTEEGNWDWVFNNTPVFFVRDAAKFPHFIHTQKRDPQTHLKDHDMFWDFLSLNPESIHQVMVLFSDRGTPDGYHHMHGYSGHAYKFVNAEGKFHYVQMHLRADKGFKTLDDNTAKMYVGENPDYGTEKLFTDIENGEFPSWTLYVQTMTPEQAEKFRYNILDITKVWPHAEFPLREVGKLTLNQNPENYFADVEQIAFSPASMVPGVEASADPMLQSRLFSYPDTQRHRIGANYNQLPINAPMCPVANFQRDGAMCFVSQGARPNYQSSILPLTYKKKPYQNVKHELFIGHAIAEMQQVTEIDFEQPRTLWSKVFSDKDKEHYVQNVAAHLGRVKSKEILQRQLSIFARVDPQLAERIAKAVDAKAPAPIKVRPASESQPFKIQHINGADGISV